MLWALTLTICKWTGSYVALFPSCTQALFFSSLISSVCPKHSQSLINIWVVTFLPCSKHKCAQKMRPTCFSTSTRQECVPKRKEVVRQGQGDLVNFAMKFVSWADDSEETGRGVSRKVKWKGHERMQNRCQAERLHLQRPQLPRSKYKMDRILYSL